MKTTVTLCIRGNLTAMTVNAQNPSNGAAIAMQQLPAHLDRMRDIRIINCIGECGFKVSGAGGQVNPPRLNK